MKPIGVRQRLARRAHDVCIASFENILSLFERANAPGDDDRRLVPSRAYRPADLGTIGDVAPERPARVRSDGRHAFVSAGTGVGVGRPPHLRLLRVLEFPTPGEREIIHPSLGEPRPKIFSVLHLAAAGYAIPRQVPAADHKISRNGGTDGVVHLERQANPVLSRASVSIVSIVQCRQKRRHRVGVGVVQLDAVESRRFRAGCGRAEDAGKLLGQLPNVRLMCVRDALAVPESKRFELPFRQHVV